MVWLDLFFQHGSEQTQSMLPLPQFFKVTDDGRIALKWYSKVTEANPMNKRDTFLDSNLVLRKWILSNHVWWILMVCHEKVYEICFPMQLNLSSWKGSCRSQNWPNHLEPCDSKVELSRQDPSNTAHFIQSSPQGSRPKNESSSSLFPAQLNLPIHTAFPIPFWQFNIAIEITISNR